MLIGGLNKGHASSFCLFCSENPSDCSPVPQSGSHRMQLRWSADLRIWGAFAQVLQRTATRARGSALRLNSAGPPPPGRRAERWAPTERANWNPYAGDQIKPTQNAQAWDSALPSVRTSKLSAWHVPFPPSLTTGGAGRMKQEVDSDGHSAMLPSSAVFWLRIPVPFRTQGGGLTPTLTGRWAGAGTPS